MCLFLNQRVDCCLPEIVTDTVASIPGAPLGGTRADCPSEIVELRITGSPDKPTLIYFPGLHGDWTLIRSFQIALRGAVRFVEITYPRNPGWSLREYATGVQSALNVAGINGGWLLGESFGSQVVWELLRLREAGDQSILQNVDGLILAGGFVRYPFPAVLPVVQAINRAMPMWLLRAFCRLYAWYAKFRHRRATETLCDVQEFIRRRSQEPDRQAIASRYSLIKESDARDTARAAAIPVFQLCGFFDPIVPWIPVRRWLKRNCRSYGGWKMICAADHNVLGSAPEASAQQVLQWLSRIN